MREFQELEGILEDDKGKNNFYLRISDPITGETGQDYYCLVHAPLLFKSDKRIYGMSKEQAMLLAREFVKRMLLGKILLDKKGQPIELWDP